MQNSVDQDIHTLESNLMPLCEYFYQWLIISFHSAFVILFIVVPFDKRRIIIRTKIITMRIRYPWQIQIKQREGNKAFQFCWISTEDIPCHFVLSLSLSLSLILAMHTQFSMKIACCCFFFSLTKLHTRGFYNCKKSSGFV